jgi:hypothetical protein
MASRRPVRVVFLLAFQQLISQPVVVLSVTFSPTTQLTAIYIATILLNPSAKILDVIIKFLLDPAIHHVDNNRYLQMARKCRANIVAMWGGHHFVGNGKVIQVIHHRQSFCRSKMVIGFLYERLVSGTHVATSIEDQQ